MNAKFTPSERLWCGLYFGIVAALSLSAIFADILFLTPIFIGGLCSGLLIPAAIINPIRYSTLRAIGAGCLTTLCSALIAGLLFGIFYDAPFQLADLKIDSFVKLVKRLQQAIRFMVLGAAFAVPFSLIGSIAAIAFSRGLTKHRKKIAPEIEPDVFE
ncbi:hypothetical protein [Kiloniella majae]|uniref:hypothetical protein n=1 Tax=Kiloniella majae TaxID=1938558 RepID=UPI000A27805E|nr:hypothetical protein [Kiloniella majae]